MCTRVLLVLPKQESLGDLVLDVLEEQLGTADAGGALVTRAASEAEAKQWALQGGFDLLITHLTIPADRRTPLDESERRGLTLLQQLEQGGVRLPSIIIAKAIDGSLHAARRGLSDCELALVDLGLEDELCVALDRLALRRPASDRVNGSGSDSEAAANAAEAVGARLWEPAALWEPERRSNGFATIDIMIYSPAAEVHYSIRREGYDSQYLYTGTLSVDHRVLKRLADKSRTVPRNEYPLWVETLRDIGRELAGELFADQKFHKHFWYAVAEAGGLERTRIRFGIDRQVYPVALEALLDPNEDDADTPFWMLRAAALTRRLTTLPGRFYPLFFDEPTRRGPINCLIIEADVAVGHIDGIGEVPRLANVPEECGWLARFLRGEETERPSVRAQVRHLRPEDAPPGVPFRRHIENVLKDGTTWHLVHYGGHSHYDEDKEEGFVLLPADRDAEAVPIEEFAAWLDGVRFVYLSSCRGSEDSVAFELARHRVPAIVGFRWDIEDSKAIEHARIFYTELLARSPSLEQAFLAARKALYHRWKEDTIWAAPMMMLQVNG